MSTNSVERLARCRTGRLVLFGILLIPLIGAAQESMGKGRAESAEVAVVDPAPNAAIFAIWANSGEDKVVQHDLRVSRTGDDVRNRVWDGSQISLFAGRNEVVAFNLILECPRIAAQNVQVSCGPIEGPQGFALTSGVPHSADSVTSSADVFDFRGRQVELFFVRYLPIRGTSVLAYEHYDERHVPRRMRRPFKGQGKAFGQWSDRPDHDQFYPDIAVPIELETPFSIKRATNQSIWVDVFVPKQSPVGSYYGHVTVSYDTGDRSDRRVVKLPVTLTVRRYTLPDYPTAKTMVYISDENINRRYLGQAYPNVQSRTFRRSTRIIDRHFQLAHRHKLSLVDDYKPIALVDHVWRSRLDGSLFTPKHGYEGVGIGVGNNVYSIGTYGSWPWQDSGRTAMWAQADAWVRWFESQEFATETDYFLYLIDESKDYEAIERWSRWVDQNPGPGRRLQTMATIPLPVAVSKTPSLDVVASTVMAAPTQAWQAAASTIQGREPEHLMLYNGWRPASGCFVTEDDGVALRQLAWCQFKMSIHRWFAWESTYYNNYQGGQGETNVFRQAQTFGGRTRRNRSRGETGWNYNNGDGVLFYPGTDAQFPEDSYNVPGPFASLRLKHWRRGIQDVDYLAMAAAKHPDKVQQLVERMIPCVLWEVGVTDPNDPTWVLSDISWPTDPDAWGRARAQLADWIAP